MKQWLLEVSRLGDLGGGGPDSIEVFPDVAREHIHEGDADGLGEGSLEGVGNEEAPIVRDLHNVVPAPAVPGKPSERLAVLRLKEYQDDDEPLIFLVWHNAPEKLGEEPNIGIGIGSNQTNPEAPPAYVTDKYENRWFKFTELDGNPKRRAELVLLSRDELIDLIVRLEAVQTQ